MPRYGDLDELAEVLERNFGHTGGAAVLKQLIDNAPTLNVEAGLAIENLKAIGSLAAARYQLERIYNGEICGTCDPLPFGQGDVCVKCLRNHIGKLLGEEAQDGK